MIELIGPKDIPEFKAAEVIAKSLEDLWPGVMDSPIEKDYIKIIAGAKLSGYRISDIDIILIGQLNRPRYFIPTRELSDNDRGKSLKNTKIKVDNFIVAIELKEHPPENVSINGNNIIVSYKNSTHSATEQNVKQIHTLKEYFDDRYSEFFFIHGFVYLPNIAYQQSDFLGYGFSGRDILTIIASKTQPRFNGVDYYISSASPRTFTKTNIIASDQLFKKIIPTNIDRVKMDNLIKENRMTEEIIKDIGNRPVHLRGYGGSGKTIMMLSAAWRQYEMYDKRTIVLTYNVALAADITRILYLLNISTDEGSRCIKVDTIYSHIYKIFYELGLVGTEIDDFSEYDNLLQKLMVMIDNRSVDLSSLKNVNHDYDIVMIDESQDWKDAEIKILKMMYGQNKICISDGINQLIRGKKAIWFDSQEKQQVKIIPLEKSLRMKRNLGLFVQDYAALFNLPCKIEPNSNAGGGIIKIYNESYTDISGLHDSLDKSSMDSGNMPIDSLFCSNSSDKFEAFFKSKNKNIWNGFDIRLKKDFPRNNHHFRILHYESVRGLEGWNVVLDELDVYYNSLISSGSDVLQAAERILIALTRPIDTLVITLKDLDCEFSQRILELKNRDYVEFYG